MYFYSLYAILCPWLRVILWFSVLDSAIAQYKHAVKGSVFVR